MQSSFSTQFHRRRAVVRIVTIAMMMLVVVSIGLATSIGRIDIPMSSVVQAILDVLGLSESSSLDPIRKAVIVDIRMSRVCLAGLVGMALAVSGVAFQGILRNPLADPFTIGVSTGAAFGASMAIFFGWGTASLLGMGLLPLAALAGALAALIVVMGLARVEGRLRRDTMVLAGIVVATFLAALISLFKSLDEESVSSIVFWVMGSFQGRGWTHVLFALPYAAVGMILVSAQAHELDVLSLGDTHAGQLGVDVEKVRRRILVGAGLLTAAAVSVSGVIGFVGLVVPHVVRMIFGADHRPLLVLSALLGTITLIWSDVIARTVLPLGEELPVGVVTALMGGPFFCLLLKGKKNVVGID